MWRTGRAHRTKIRIGDNFFFDLSIEEAVYDGMSGSNARTRADGKARYEQQLLAQLPWIEVLYTKDDSQNIGIPMSLKSLSAVSASCLTALTRTALNSRMFLDASKLDSAAR